MFYKLIISILFITSMGMSLPLASDGQGAGNGGDAIVCRDADGKITSSETLDRFEARVLRDLIPKGFDENNSVEKNYSILIERIEKFSPIRAKRYATNFDEFFNDSKLVKTDLIDIPDSEHVVVPRGCKIEQLVIQQKKRTPFDKKYIVQEQIWQSLNSIDQAIMILHEAILDESIEQFEKLDWEIVNTRGLRYFNSLVFSFDLDDIYTNLTEEMIVESLYMIPNFSLVELKNFGQLVLKIKFKNDQFFKFVDAFNENGVVDEVYLYNNQYAGTGLVSKIYDVTFHFHDERSQRYNKFYYHLKMIDDEKMSVIALAADRHERTKKHRLYLSRGIYRERNRLVFLKNADYSNVYQVDQTLILNYKTNKVIGYVHRPDSGNYKEYFPLGSTEIEFYPSRELEFAASYSDNRLTYKLCPNFTEDERRYGEGKTWESYLIFKEQYTAIMNSDCRETNIDFGANGGPLLPIKIQVDEDFWGMWDSQKNEDKEFTALPLKLNDGFLVHFQAQKLPKSLVDYKYIARDTFGLLIQKRNYPERRKCLRVNVGSSWPVSIHKRWQSANRSCKLSSK